MTQIVVASNNLQKEPAVIPKEQPASLTLHFAQTDQLQSTNAHLKESIMVYTLPPEPQTIHQPLNFDDYKASHNHDTTRKIAHEKFYQQHLKPVSLPQIHGSRRTRKRQNDLLEETTGEASVNVVKEYELDRAERHMIVPRKVSNHPFDFISAHESMVEFLGKRMASSELPHVEEEDYVLGESIQAYLQHTIEGKSPLDRCWDLIACT